MRPAWGAGVVKRSMPCKKDAKQLVSIIKNERKLTIGLHCSQGGSFAATAVAASVGLVVVVIVEDIVEGGGGGKRMREVRKGGGHCWWWCEEE